MSTQPDSTPQATAEAPDKGVGCDALLAVCKNCRHWHWWPGFEERNNTFKNRPCAMAGEDDSDADDRATVFNSIDSYIATGPNFGCRHFSAANTKISHAEDKP